MDERQDRTGERPPPPPTQKPEQGHAQPLEPDAPTSATGSHSGAAPSEALPREEPQAMQLDAVVPRAASRDRTVSPDPAPRTNGSLDSPAVPPARVTTHVSAPSPLPVASTSALPVLVPISSFARVSAPDLKPTVLSPPLAPRLALPVDSHEVSPTVDLRVSVKSETSPMSPPGGKLGRAESVERKQYAETRWSDRKPSRPSAAVSEGSSSASGSVTPNPRESKPVVKKERKPKVEKVKVEEGPAQLIGDLRLATTEALAEFIEIDACTYANKALGNVVSYGEEEGNSHCECTYYDRVEKESQACGVGAQCINRSMQIECTIGDCKCGSACQNQMFERRQYAPIEIVRTEKKGYGVRVGADLDKGTFIYEYVGEVIGPTSLAKRLKDYAKEGIEHFYFMSLDKEVYIDATKKGGKARFLNHSCNPNCAVGKWTVGKKQRMGIFAKRDLLKDEELTFNYNVDRYGHQAQVCHCGELNCVGVLGGKTQTEIGGMDELYIEALGIENEVKELGLRGAKKKNGKKVEEVDFTPILKPIALDEVDKVAAAVRQATPTRRILEKLLQRIVMTDDAEVQGQLLRLRGFTLMFHILKQYPTDHEIIILDLRILAKWPLVARNKLEDSKIEPSVRRCLEIEDPRIQELTTELLASWQGLELAYRIPRGKEESEGSADRKRAAEGTISMMAKRSRFDSTPAPSTPEPSRPVFIRPEAVVHRALPGAPPGWDVFREEGLKGRVYFKCQETGAIQWDTFRAVKREKPVASVAMDVASIIARTQAIAEATSKKEEDRRMEVEGERKRERNKESQLKADKVKGAKLAAKDKKVMGLFSAVVIGVMSKYKGSFEADQFKKRAKEVTQILCDKEKKHPAYATERYEALSTDKTSKVKSFTKDWVKKLLDRASRSSSITSTPTTPARPSLGSSYSSSNSLPTSAAPSRHPLANVLSKGSGGDAARTDAMEGVE